MANWPINIDLQQDELFSSWIIRVALKHGISPIDLTGLIWQKRRVWTTDIDRILPSSGLNKLSDSSGVSIARLHNSTFHGLLSKISGNIGDHGLWPWLIPYGVRNRSYRGGIQFCSDCLKEDNNPYLRKSWRLAWNVSCHKHRSYFFEFCPECQSLIEPNKLSEKNRLICVCSNCKADFRDFSTNQNTEDNFDIQNQCQEIVHNEFSVFDKDICSSKDWFKLLRFYILIISRCSNTKLTSLPLLLRYFDVEYINTNLTGLGFEYLSIKERSMILDGCQKLLNVGTEKLTEIINNIGVSKNTFIGINSNIPTLFKPIFEKIEKENTQKPIAKNKLSNPVEKAVILRKYRRLLRKYRLKTSE